MLDSPTQTPILDWLDLKPELLSAAHRVAPGLAQPFVPMETSSTISVTAQSVLPFGGMVFYQPAPTSPPPALGAMTHAYRTPGQGGAQEQALAEMAGYFSAGSF